MDKLSKELIEKLAEVGITLSDEHFFNKGYFALLMVTDKAYNFTVVKKFDEDCWSVLVFGYFENKEIAIPFKGSNETPHNNLTDEELIELAEATVKYIETIGKENTWEKYTIAWGTRLKQKLDENHAKEQEKHKEMESDR